MTTFKLNAGNGDGRQHVWLAAFDASPEDKELADYILSEHETISEALHAVGFTRGKVHLSEGTFPDAAA